MIEKFPLRQWLKRLRDPSPWTFSRWGDGEWRSVLKRHRKNASNCDGHAYFPELRRDLIQALCRPPEYMLGMQYLALRVYGKEIEKFLQTHDLQHLRWYEADVFHYGAIHGQLPEIAAAAASREPVIVGPPHLRKLKSAGIPYRHFVEIPPKNCYLEVDGIFREIMAVAEESSEPLLISLSASMASEVLCDRLYPRIGDRHTIIDFGSLWDPLVGKKSRRYMQDARS